MWWKIGHLLSCLHLLTTACTTRPFLAAMEWRFFLPTLHTHVYIWGRFWQHCEWCSSWSGRGFLLCSMPVSQTVPAYMVWLQIEESGFLFHDFRTALSSIINFPSCFYQGLRIAFLKLLFQYFFMLLRGINTFACLNFLILKSIPSAIWEGWASISW